MTMTGATVVGIRLCVGSRDPMKIVDDATVITGEGIEGDRHRRADGQRTQRQILLMDRETIGKFELQDGDVRENITVEGMDFSTLKDGDKVSIGSEVILRITGDCEPCSRMDELRQGLKDELDGQRGMLAFAEKGGIISTGDSVMTVTS